MYVATAADLLKKLSIPPQDSELNILTLRGEVNAFLEEISLWRWRVNRSNFRDFPLLEKTLPSCSSEEQSMLVSQVSQHVAMLAKAFDGFSSLRDRNTAEK